MTESTKGLTGQKAEYLYTVVEGVGDYNLSRRVYSNSFWVGERMIFASA